jgi:membrane protein DedA with SNARE-associated domain
MGQLNIGLLFAVFMTSAVLGDAVNYALGSKLGEPGAAAAPQH